MILYHEKPISVEECKKIYKQNYCFLSHLNKIDEVKTVKDLDMFLSNIQDKNNGICLWSFSLEDIKSGAFEICEDIDYVYVVDDKECRLFEISGGN